jgi:hypothetical protein
MMKPAARPPSSSLSATPRPPRLTVTTRTMRRGAVSATPCPARLGAGTPPP